MTWNTTDGSLPEVGDDVIVFRREDFDLYAIAHLEETDDGETYWDSDSDVFHGQPAEYASHWAPLPAAPRT